MEVTADPYLPNGGNRDQIICLATYQHMPAVVQRGRPTTHSPFNMKRLSRISKSKMLGCQLDNGLMLVSLGVFKAQDLSGDRHRNSRIFIGLRKQMAVGVKG